MITVTTIKDMRLKRREAGSHIVGLVPTMGALHAGHVSLIERCRKRCDCVVVSIFVNPAQFGPAEDFTSYPRTLEADLGACERAGVDMVFAPAVEEMYPERGLTRVDVPELSSGLCGRHRPGHFAGVCTVVAKLLNIVRPARAYFGQKDAQQAAVIIRMVADLDFDVEIVVRPTIREPDGLAMSSRNAYLTPEQRSQAAALYRSLDGIRAAVRGGEIDRATLVAAARAEIEAAGPCTIGYVELVDASSLEPVQRVSGPTLAAAAVTIGGCRLIDNVLIDEVPKRH